MRGKAKGERRKAKDKSQNSVALLRAAFCNAGGGIAASGEEKSGEDEQGREDETCSHLLFEEYDGEDHADHRLQINEDRNG